jgi:hypothetical protein
MRSSVETRHFFSLGSWLTLLAGLLLAVGCRDRQTGAAPRSTRVTPTCEVYRGELERSPAAAPSQPPAASDTIVGTAAGGGVTLQLSADHSQVTSIAFVLHDVAWSKKTETILSQVTMETCELKFDGPFAIGPAGDFSAPAAGLRGRFTAADRATGTLQLVYRYDLAGSPGTTGTHIAGTPDIVLPGGNSIKGTPAIDIPGIPAIQGAHYSVALGEWKWSLTGKTAAELAEESRLVRQNLLRSVRFGQTYWQANPNDERVQYREWHDGNMKLIADLAWTKCTVWGEAQTEKTTRSLIIANAPPLFRDSGSAFAVQPDGTVEKLGDHAFMPVKMPGAETASLFMVNDVDTNGQWIGVDGEKIIERGESEAATQIGTLAYRDIVLATGASAKKVLMTRSAEPGAAWEGEVDAITYRELEGGKAQPVEQLEFRRAKGDDGKEHLLLMARPVKGEGPWTGVRNGKIFHQ